MPRDRPRAQKKKKWRKPLHGSNRNKEPTVFRIPDASYQNSFLVSVTSSIVHRIMCERLPVAVTRTLHCAKHTHYRLLRRTLWDCCAAGSGTRSVSFTHQ